MWYYLSAFDSEYISVKKKLMSHLLPHKNAKLYSKILAKYITLENLIHW